MFLETFRRVVCASSMRMTCMPVLCLGLITISSCNPNAIHGSGVSKTETRAVGSFSKIDLAGSPDVEVAVGADTSVVVTADDLSLIHIFHGMLGGGAHT